MKDPITKLGGIPVFMATVGCDNRKIVRNIAKGYQSILLDCVHSDTSTTVSVSLNNPNATTLKDMASVLDVLGFGLGDFEGNKARRIKKQLTREELIRMIVSATDSINKESDRFVNIKN